MVCPGLARARGQPVVAPPPPAPIVTLSDARKMLAEKADAENKLTALFASVTDRRAKIKSLRTH